MRTAVYSLLSFCLLMACIVAGFKLYKWHQSIDIEPNDHSMEPEFKYGNYGVDVSATRADQLVVGSAVAYQVPGNAGRLRVAYVVATEGQRVAVRQGQLLVNGNPSDVKVSGLHEDVPAYAVPRGCAVLMARVPEDDSLKYGPIPMRNILGRLK